MKWLNRDANGSLQFYWAFRLVSSSVNHYGMPIYPLPAFFVQGLWGVRKWHVREIALFNGCHLLIHTYTHTYLLRLPSTGLFSHNVNYYIILVIKKRKENLFTVVQLNSKYIQNYSKYIQNYFVWNILVKSLHLKLSISLVFLILSASPFHSLGPRK